jgi:hypothetical protein
VREEIENETEAITDDVGYEIRMSGMRISESINELKDRVKNVEIRIRKMNKEVLEEDLYYVDEE